MIFGGSSALASRLLLSWKSISNQAKFCATVTGLVKVDVPVQVLVERALEPLRQRQVTILAQQKELKGKMFGSGGRALGRPASGGGSSGAGHIPGVQETGSAADDLNPPGDHGRH